MQTELIILSISTITLILCIGVFRVEDSRGGKRIFLGRIRSGFDTAVAVALQKLTQVDTYLGRGIARLTLHYAAHGILQRLLAWVTATQNKVEYLLKRNKQVVREIRTTDAKKTHLDALKEHKEETALSEQEKRKLKSHD